MWTARVLLLTLSCHMLALAAGIPLESVTLDGTALPKEIILEVSGLRIGSPIDKAGIEAACLKLHQSGLFSSLEYRYATGPKGGFALTLKVTDHGSMLDATIDVPGVGEDGLWQWLAARYPSFNRKLPGNDAAQQFVARKLEAYLGAKLNGQRLVARLEADLTRGGKPVVSLQPEVLPRIASLTFSGQQEFTSEELDKILRKAKALDGYTDRGFRMLLEFNVRQAYENRGMYRVRFLNVTPQFTDPSAVSVAVRVEDGPRFTLGEVQLIGEGLPAGPMLGAAKVKKGQTANWSEIQQGIWDMERIVKRTGYFNATAVPERNLDDSRRVLDLKIPFRMGPLYRFGRLSLVGLSAEAEAQARKIWRLRPGDPFDYAYPSDFIPVFSQTVRFDRPTATEVKMAPGTGDNVMDFTLIFRSR
jgi:outer membrane protein assembly factor BamA